MKINEVKKYLAEFIGTCLLVVFGCGTACAAGCKPEGGYLITALAFGLAIAAMAYSIGNISGCHVNPAVSLAMLITKKLSVRDFIGYVVSQFLGGILGAAILLAFFGKDSGLGTNALFKQNYGLSILAEIILTFMFVFAILGVTSKKKFENVSGLVIALSLTLVHLFGIGVTGTSVNPARSFGPALFVGGDSLKIVWVFLLAPLVGSAIAAFCWKYIGSKDE